VRIGSLYSSAGVCRQSAVWPQLNWPRVPVSRPARLGRIERSGADRTQRRGGEPEMNLEMSQIDIHGPWTDDRGRVLSTRPGRRADTAFTATPYVIVNMPHHEQRAGARYGCSHVVAVQHGRRARIPHRARGRGRCAPCALDSSSHGRFPQRTVDCSSAIWRTASATMCACSWSSLGVVAAADHIHQVPEVRAATAYASHRWSGNQRLRSLPRTNWGLPRSAGRC
jgi:hypothetical protein